jgi:seryl-tRNA synthetase
MTDVLTGTAEQVAFYEELAERGLLLPSGVPGLYGWNHTFEEVRVAVDGLITRAGSDVSESMHFPPLLPRRRIEEIGYLQSFPHLAGSVFSFEGDEDDAVAQAEHAARHEDWSEHQHMTKLALVPAACYPVYPIVASRGALREGGVVVDAGGGWVFRHEPSQDPARLQMFRQREIVRLGAPDEVLAWRDAWSERGLGLLRSLELEAERDHASDPFFGRAGRMLKANQRQQELKLELLVPIAGEEPTAVASFNYHRDHFAVKFGLQLRGGDTAHTACLGFGQERITLALLRRHGLEPSAWPQSVRRELWGS